MNHLGTKKLISNRLILRKFLSNDSIELLEGYFNQDEFLYYANKTKKNLGEIEKWLLEVNDRYKEVNYYNWAIVLKDTNKIIGAINLRVNESNDCVEFNYAIDNRYTGNGYMTEALNAVKEFCMNELNVARFQGGCCIQNIASKRVMEKCNLVCEGILRKYIKLKDGYHDMCMYSIINEI